MVEHWETKYRDLTDYIGRQPEIAIEPASVTIPAEARAEFYRLFDLTRAAVLTELLPGALSQAQELSRAYLGLARDVSAGLALTEVLLPNPLGWFLRDPMDGLRRPLFDPLFDLVKGKSDPARFECYVQQEVTRRFGAWYKAGYSRWVSLSLLKGLQPDRLFQVTNRPVAEHSDWTIIRANYAAERAPHPQASTRLSFEHKLEDLFTVPDFIVHSVALDRFVAVRVGMNMPIATALDRSAKREWLTFEPASFASDPILVYAADAPEDVAVVADAKQFCRPDLVLLAVGPGGAGTPDREQAAQSRDLLQPELGAFIAGVSAPAPPPPAPVGDIPLLVTGFEPSSLAPVVAALRARGGR